MKNAEICEGTSIVLSFKKLIAQVRSNDTYKYSLFFSSLPLKLRPLPMAYLFIMPPKRSDLSYGPGRFGISGLIFGPDIPTATLISCKLLLKISIYLYIKRNMNSISSI